MCFLFYEKPPSVYSAARFGLLTNEGISVIFLCNHIVYYGQNNVIKFFFLIIIKMWIIKVKFF